MQTTIVVHVSGPAATAINFLPVAGPFVAPVAAGTMFGHVQIQPVDWTGDISVTGADADKLTVNNARQLVAAAVIPNKGDYSVTLTTQE